MSFPPGNEIFQFPGFASTHYVFICRYSLLSGFPHSEIPGSKGVSTSPGLIAAYHVLHRLSTPRHPPDALHSLTPLHNSSRTNDVCAKARRLSGLALLESARPSWRNRAILSNNLIFDQLRCASSCSAMLSSITPAITKQDKQTNLNLPVL